METLLFTSTFYLQHLSIVNSFNTSQVNSTVGFGRAVQQVGFIWHVIFFPQKINGSNPECVFVEEFLENNYTALVSAKYKGWYLGFNRRGRPKKGSRTTQTQQEVHFMKRDPKGKVDPQEEFRFTTVTKRTRRARRLRLSHKTNWSDMDQACTLPLQTSQTFCLKNIIKVIVIKQQEKKTERWLQDKKDKKLKKVQKMFYFYIFGSLSLS